MADIDEIWRVPDERVAAGLMPGYVAALRIGGQVHTRAHGRMGVEPDSPPMSDDTIFRIASVTKPIGGALALGLVEDGVLALDDPVERWLPEAGAPRVLVAPDAPLDQTIAAPAPITVRHLLTLTVGWGAIFEATPLQAAMIEREVYPGPMIPPMSGDEFVARVAGLPLAFPPGAGWLYDTGIDLAGVLLARATKRSLAELVAERITTPLGMTSTGFGTPHVERLATAYRPGPGGLELRDPRDGAFSRPPIFEELSSGLVSTAPDLLRFFTALADGGAPILRAASVATMTADALTDDQRRAGFPVLAAGGSWGIATGVNLEAEEPGMAPGRWGWDGGSGTSARVDPARDVVGVLLTQREMTGPQDGFGDFWAAVARVAPAASVARDA
jgi:CubicO group peptidase (beta-lactamase class C family)